MNALKAAPALEVFVFGGGGAGGAGIPPLPLANVASLFQIGHAHLMWWGIAGIAAFVFLAGIGLGEYIEQRRANDRYRR